MEKRFQINDLERSECRFRGEAGEKGLETLDFVAESRQAFGAGREWPLKSTA